MSFYLVNNKDKTVEAFVFLNMCNSAWLKLIFNLLTGRVSAQITFGATSFESLVHFRAHAFHFVYTFRSTFGAHNTHSLRYNAMNELNKAIKP